MQSNADANTAHSTPSIQRRHSHENIDRRQPPAEHTRRQHRYTGGMQHLHQRSGNSNKHCRRQPQMALHKLKH